MKNLMKLMILAALTLTPTFARGNGPSGYRGGGYRPYNSGVRVNVGIGFGARYRPSYYPRYYAAPVYSGYSGYGGSYGYNNYGYDNYGYDGYGYGGYGYGGNGYDPYYVAPPRVVVAPRPFYRRPVVVIAPRGYSSWRRR